LDFLTVYIGEKVKIWVSVRQTQNLFHKDLDTNVLVFICTYYIEYMNTEFKFQTSLVCILFLCLCVYAISPSGHNCAFSE